MTEASEQDAYALLTSLVRRQAFDFEAVAELAAMGERAVSALEAQLEIEDPRARRFAIRVLAKIAARPGIASLLNVAMQERESDPELVALALRGATDALGPDDTAKVAKVFASFCQHDDAFVRAAAVDGLAKVEADVPRLFLKLASDEDEFVADRAKAALGDKAALASEAEGGSAGGLSASDLSLLTRLASRTKSERLGAIREIIASGTGPETVSRLLDGEDHRMIRLALLETAHHLMSEGCYPALRSIIEDPEARDGERALAFQALVAPDSVADSELVAMVERFGRTRDPFERAAAAAFGMRSKRVLVVEAASAKLRDDEGHVRETVARAFRDVPEGAAVPQVITRLRDIGSARFPNSKAIEEWASLVEGLVRLSKARGFIGQDAAQVMLDAMRSAPDSVRGLAADAFDRFADVESLPPRSVAEAAAAFIAAGNYDRGLALIAPANADVDFAVPALVKALHRTGADDTYAIAQALTRSDLPAARGAVARLGNHFDSRVRELAQGAAPAPSYGSAYSPATAPSAVPPPGYATTVASPQTPDLDAFPQPSPAPIAAPKTSAASAALADAWGVGRPTVRPGGEAISTADRKRPPVRKIPESAPVLLQEPPSTYRVENGDGTLERTEEVKPPKTDESEASEERDEPVASPEEGASAPSEADSVVAKPASAEVTPDETSSEVETDAEGPNADGEATDADDA